MHLVQVHAIFIHINVLILSVVVHTIQKVIKLLFVVIPIVGIILISNCFFEFHGILMCIFVIVVGL